MPAGAAPPGGGGEGGGGSSPLLAEHHARQASFGDSPRLSCAPMETVDEATWSGPSLRSGVAECLGARRTLEDANVALDELEADADAPLGFYAVFDGHSGRAAATYAAEHLLAAIQRHPGWEADVPAAMRAGLAATDEEMRLGGDAFKTCGTTALAALLLGRRLYVANVGDCRAVLSRRGRCVDLSTDHKPTTDSERERIQAAGGFVDSEGYLNGTLGVSRALGDWHAECSVSHTRLKAVPPGPDATSSAAASAPLIAEADIQEHELTSEDEFLLLACDGLWDVLSSQNAVQLARSQLQRFNDPTQCAAYLAREAIDALHSGDNVTVVAVCLSAQPPPVRPAAGSGLVTRAGSRLFARSMSQEVLSNLQRALDSDDPAPSDGAAALLATL